MNRIDLKIFHYHFLTGGVATVVQQALKAFHAHLPEIRSIELVAGRVPEGIRGAISRYNGKWTVVPEIDYRDPGKGDKKEIVGEAGKLARQLLDSFGSDDSIWWVHNYHLGKNAVFTQALLQIIYSGGAQRIILQIHDFPECGRFQNLRYLLNTLSLDPYPLSPWVRYAVLNQRDRNILIQAGVPAQAVFLLENPVFQDRVPERRNSATLKRAFGKSFPRFDPLAPLLLYPIRTIRRKNAMEAVLLCLLLESPANILITLPGVSAAEKPYSAVVEKIFTDGLCPGLWGIGTALERVNLSFADLVAGSDLVLSTSVQEGFGYLFINSLLWSLPLVARNLDILEGLKGLFTEYPAYFYDRILVPFAEGPSLRKAYRRKILSLSDLLPEEEKQRLLGSAETLLQDDLVDFSYLPVAEQDRFLRERSVSEKLGICRRENGRTLSELQTLLSTLHGGGESGWSDNRRGEVQRRFGAAAYAEGFRSLTASFGTHPASSAELKRSGDPGTSVQEAVLKAFLKIEHLRLLYD